MVVEQEFLSKELEESADQEDVVRGIASMNDVEATTECYFYGERELPEQCDPVFEHVAQRAICFDGVVIAANFDAVQQFKAGLMILPGRANNCYAVTGFLQGRCFLPDSPIEGNGKILDNYQNTTIFFLHAIWLCESDV